MTNRLYSILSNRGTVAVIGPDAASFLQGLVSNDVDKVSETQAIWAAFLTPQGKFLHEFMIVKRDEGYLLECERDRRDDLITRLKRFRLRAKVTIEDADDLEVATAWGSGISEAFGLQELAGAANSNDDVVTFVDPRLPDAGVRLIGPSAKIHSVAQSAGCDSAQLADYDLNRMQLGLPDGSRDMEVDKALLLENGFEELAGVDFDKGCYIGQELTARTHYRALIKKRLLPVSIEGPAPPAGAPLTVDGKDAGEMKSSTGTYGLALIRLGVWQTAPDGVLTFNETQIKPAPAPWMVLPGGSEGQQ